MIMTLGHPKQRKTSGDVVIEPSLQKGRLGLDFNTGDPFPTDKCGFLLTIGCSLNVTRHLVL